MDSRQLIKLIKKAMHLAVYSATAGEHCTREDEELAKQQAADAWMALLAYIRQNEDKP